MAAEEALSWGLGEKWAAFSEAGAALGQRQLLRDCEREEGFLRETSRRRCLVLEWCRS
jgi:hypothetical protein